MFLKKMISILLVVSLLLSVVPIQSFAQNSAGILLSETVASKIQKKLSACLETDKLIVILDLEKNELLTQKDLDEKKITNLNLNITELKKETDGFKKAYLDKNESLNKLQEGIPSRMTWFGVGAGISTAIGIAMMFLIKG